MTKPTIKVVKKADLKPSASDPEKSTVSLSWDVVRDGRIVAHCATFKEAREAAQRERAK